LTRRNRRSIYCRTTIPVVKVLPARRATGPLPGRRSSGPLVGELLIGDHGSGERRWWTHEDGSRTCLGAVSTAPWSSVVPGSTRSLQLSVSAALAQDRILRCVVPELVGGDEETRTPDPLLAKEMLCQLSYVPLPGWMVGVSGLEPETSALSGQCSNQLS
jgi:hypothetical protein